MTASERAVVLKWRARKWVPPEPEDIIDFWEADLSIPDDPVLSAEQAAAHAALLRVARLERARR